MEYCRLESSRVMWHQRSPRSVSARPLDAEAAPGHSGSAVLRRLRSRDRTDWNTGYRRVPRSSTLAEWAAQKARTTEA